MLPASRSTVVLRSRNGSRERGVASITFGLHETKVVIRLSGAPRGARQPALLYDGGCQGSRKLVVNLGAVVNGRRVARVNPLPRVSGFAIDVHESTSGGAAVVACGMIPRRR